MKRRQTLGLAAGTVVGWAVRRARAVPADDGPRVFRWGHSEHVDLAHGQTHAFAGREIKLITTEGATAKVTVDGDEVVLRAARLGLPVVVSGVRLHLADSRPLIALTRDDAFPQHRGLVKRDALLGLSDPARPLLDPERFVFPIDRADGYRWSMEENSHQFAFISPERSHEGIDIDLHHARGYRVHALVAIEDTVVRWVERDRTSKGEACVMLESAAQPGVHYVYQHLNRHEVLVRPGDKLSRGARIGYIWGDGIWGHLHFAVLAHGPAPDFPARYRDLVNAFPGLYELWHGDLAPRPRRHQQGDFFFDRNKAAHGNRKYLCGYNPLLGYGFRIDDFCAADRVESGPERGPGDLDSSARLRRTLFAGTAASARNPRDHYDFQVDVEPGRYEVQVRVGDGALPTWQRIAINGRALGVHARPAGFTWTPRAVVAARAGALVVRVGLQGEKLAALSALSFRRIG